MVKNIYWSFRKYLLYYYPVLMKLEFSGQIFEKYLDIKLQKNYSCGNPFETCGLKD
jgi:hypothetical protein